MDITKIIQVLSEALDDKDWDIIKELLEELIYEEENPIQEYEKDSDLESEDEVQLLPVEFDEWYSNDFNSSVPVTANAERTLVMTGPSNSNSSMRPFIEFTAAIENSFEKLLSICQNQ